MRKQTSGVVMAVVIGAVAMALGGAPASATPVVVFQDSFDGETGSGDGASGQSKVNYTAFAQWTVSDGSVDLIANGDYGIDCFGGAGKCVDLDGGTNNAGVLTSSIALNLAAGSYEFSFQLSGTDSGFTQTNAKIPNVVDVSIGGLFATTITANQGDPFAEYGGSFDVLVPTTVSIVFGNQGGDQFGAMLDSVKLEMVPEPAAAALLALGLGGLGALGRRRA
ncbi:MAG: sorting protein [Deltaproteobacteria bacterium]|nr:sorting protein [Deltaproteobacteria bacterium]